MPAKLFTESIPLPGATLHGDLTIPDMHQGTVLFAHGSGSSRRSSRNQHVARRLNSSGLATLLFDLLTEEEESVDLVTAELRFDIGFLSQRLLGATEWLIAHPRMQDTKLGYFGASTGAAAALVAASRLGNDIKAVVSRGGRPDLAGSALVEVKAPTLLIVGGEDHEVRQLNHQAMAHMHCEKKLEIVPGATHLFEEADALDEVSQLSRAWFERYLQAESNKTRVA